MNREVSLLKYVTLGPMALICKFIVNVRNFLYETGALKSKEYDIPVISVGNISVGGTGKTPHTEFLISLLKDNYKIAVVSRGYRRKSHGFHIVECTDNYLMSGDEPLQIKRKFPDVIVAVCKNRVTAINRLREQYPDINVVILDDAFQHRKVKQGLNIVLNNYNHTILKDYVLPLGRLREPRHSLHRANILIYSNCPQNIKPIERRILGKEMNVLPYQNLYFSMVKYKSPIAMRGKGKIVNLDDFSKYNVLAITGIAHYSAFISEVEKHALSVTHIAFPDHHRFTSADIHTIIKKFEHIQGPKVIVTTEKDAMRLGNEKLFDDKILSNMYYIPITIELICDEEEKKYFNNQIISYVKNNKQYNKFYSGKIF